MKGIGDAFEKRKTLGVGVLDGQASWFIDEAAIGRDRFTLDLPSGVLTLRMSDAGVEVLDAPSGVKTVQTFYYSWSAFRPNTIVIAGPAEGVTPK